MKTSIIIILGFMVCLLSAQTPVTDTGAITQQQLLNQKLQENTRVNQSIDRAIEAVENIQTKAKLALENATWAKALKSTTDFITLTENTVCALHDFYEFDIPNIYVSSGCLSNFGIDTSLLKMQNAYESFYMALTSGIAMTVKERLETLKNARDDFQDAIEEIETQTKQLKKVKNNRIRHQENVATIKSINP